MLLETFKKYTLTGIQFVAHKYAGNTLIEVKFLVRSLCSYSGNALKHKYTVLWLSKALAKPNHMCNRTDV